MRASNPRAREAGPGAETHTEQRSLNQTTGHRRRGFGPGKEFTEITH